MDDEEIHIQTVSFQSGRRKIRLHHWRLIGKKEFRANLKDFVGVLADRLEQDTFVPATYNEFMDMVTCGRGPQEGVHLILGSIFLCVKRGNDNREVYAPLFEFSHYTVVEKCYVSLRESLILNSLIQEREIKVPLVLAPSSTKTKRIKRPSS